MRISKTIVVLISLTMLFSACVDTKPSEVVETSLQTSLASTQPATEEPEMTETPIITKIIPTETPLPTTSVNPSPTPTQFLGFLDSWIYSTYIYDNETVFYFIVPHVAANYFAKVDGEPLTCKVDSRNVNTLFCRTEAELSLDDIKTFEFFADENYQYLVYKSDFQTRRVLNPTPTTIAYIWPRANFTAADVAWAGPETYCPLRGNNIYCEIEYRLYGSDCLVGASCYDDCGYYYSVDTIKDREGVYTFSGECW